MANEWDSYAEQWEQDPATHVFAQSAFNELTKVISLSNAHVLDFGCGTGLLSQQMSPLVKDIVALDSSEAMIEELDLKELHNVEPVVDELSRGLVAQHPAFRKQFDAIVASSVCAFLPELQQTVNVVFSLLDQGGVFVHWDWLQENEQSFGLKQQTMQKVFTKAGFTSIEFSIPFQVETQHGVQTVLMGVAVK